MARANKANTERDEDELLGDEREAAGIGHNSGGVTAGQLKSIIERIERLEEERKELGADIREIYAEAKGNGYTPKIIRMIIAMRKMNESDRAEQNALLETYCNAIGMDV